MTMLEDEECNQCHGTGWIGDPYLDKDSIPCEQCEGKGYVRSSDLMWWQRENR
jgi:DnaJ-class molecular chaperone